MTFVLALLIVVLAVAGAEFVRATCRRQLSTPLVLSPRLDPAESEARAA